MAVEEDFDFEEHKVSDEIIDAFVKRVTVNKDNYTWELNCFGKEIKCLASGTRKNPKVEMVDVPTVEQGQHRLLLHRESNN
jgi:hypothetical protein